MQQKAGVADVLRRVHTNDASFTIHQQKTLRPLRSAEQQPSADMWMHATLAATSASVIIAVATGIALNVRGTSEKNGYKSVKLTCCPARITM